MRIFFLIPFSTEVPKYMSSAEYIGHTISSMRYDQHAPNAMDAQILAAVMLFNPHIVVYVGASEGSHLPHPATFKRLRDAYAVVHLVSDAADPPWWHLLELYHEAGCFDLQVAIDGNYNWPGRNWGLTALTPIDPRFFKDPPIPHAERNNWSGFSGGLSKWRLDIIRKITAEGVYMTVRERVANEMSYAPETYRDYCNFMGNCRIAFGMPDTGSGHAKQVKGRIVEAAWAGCCLVEGKGAPTSAWFEPDTEFIEYESVVEAITVLKRMMFDERQRAQEMATRFRQRVMREHSPQVFWSRVFDRLPQLEREVA